MASEVSNMPDMPDPQDFAIQNGDGTVNFKNISYDKALEAWKEVALVAAANPPIVNNFSGTDEGPDADYQEDDVAVVRRNNEH